MTFAIPSFARVSLGLALMVAGQTGALRAQQFSIRGLSTTPTGAVWASGQFGSYKWMAGSGDTTWHVGRVPGAESMDFRDVYAVSLDTVYLMAAAQDTARIYKTVDRGAHWELQYDNTSKGMFLDAIDFFDADHGLALGDPIDGRFTMLRTDDGGKHWTPIDPAGMPAALPGEAAFAASGTCLTTFGAKHAWFATGGASASRVFRSSDGGKTWTVGTTPIKAGVASSGIFSVAFRSEKEGIAVGGDYAKPDTTAIIAAWTTDGGVTWTPARVQPRGGYLSGATYMVAEPRTAVAVGLGWQAITTDGGKTWKSKALEQARGNVVISARDGSAAVWIAGEDAFVRRTEKSELMR